VVVSLRHATLGLLAQHPASGYDLLKKFQESMAHVWPATQSQLYGGAGLGNSKVEHQIVQRFVAPAFSGSIACEA
jgi:hypothetical protein